MPEPASAETKGGKSPNAPAQSLMGRVAALVPATPAPRTPSQAATMENAGAARMRASMDSLARLQAQTGNPLGFRSYLARTASDAGQIAQAEGIAEREGLRWGPFDLSGITALDPRAVNAVPEWLRQIFVQAPTEAAAQNRLRVPVLSDMLMGAEIPLPLNSPSLEARYARQDPNEIVVEATPSAGQRLRGMLAGAREGIEGAGDFLMEQGAASRARHGGAPLQQALMQDVVGLAESIWRNPAQRAEQQAQLRDRLRAEADRLGDPELARQADTAALHALLPWILDYGTMLVAPEALLPGTAAKVSATARNAGDAVSDAVRAVREAEIGIRRAPVPEVRVSAPPPHNSSLEERLGPSIRHTRRGDFDWSRIPRGESAGGVAEGLEFDNIPPGAGWEGVPDTDAKPMGWAESLLDRIRQERIASEESPRVTSSPTTRVSPAPETAVQRRNDIASLQQRVWKQNDIRKLNGEPEMALRSVSIQQAEQLHDMMRANPEMSLEAAVASLRNGQRGAGTTLNSGIGPTDDNSPGLLNRLVDMVRGRGRPQAEGEGTPSPAPLPMDEASRMQRARERRVTDIRTPRGELHETIVNPTEADILRLTRPGRVAAPGLAIERGVPISSSRGVRYIKDLEGNIYVGNSYDVTHHDLVTHYGLPNRGLLDGGEIVRLPDGTLELQNNDGAMPLPRGWLSGRAAFDPARSGESDLLASGIPFGTGDDGPGILNQIVDFLRGRRPARVARPSEQQQADDYFAPRGFDGERFLYDEPTQAARQMDALEGHVGNPRRYETLANDGFSDDLTTAINRENTPAGGYEGAVQRQQAARGEQPQRSTEWYDGFKAEYGREPESADELQEFFMRTQAARRLRDQDGAPGSVMPPARVTHPYEPQRDVVPLQQQQAIERAFTPRQSVADRAMDWIRNAFPSGEGSTLGAGINPRAPAQRGNAVNNRGAEPATNAARTLEEVIPNLPTDANEWRTILNAHPWINSPSRAQVLIMATARAPDGAMRYSPGDIANLTGYTEDTIKPMVNAARRAGIPIPQRGRSPAGVPARPGGELGHRIVEAMERSARSGQRITGPQIAALLNKNHGSIKVTLNHIRSGRQGRELQERLDAVQRRLRGDQTNAGIDLSAIAPWLATGGYWAGMNLVNEQAMRSPAGEGLRPQAN